VIGEHRADAGERVGVIFLVPEGHYERAVAIATAASRPAEAIATDAPHLTGDERGRHQAMGAFHTNRHTAPVYLRRSARQRDRQLHDLTGHNGDRVTRLIPRYPACGIGFGRVHCAQKPGPRCIGGAPVRPVLGTLRTLARTYLRKCVSSRAPPAPEDKVLRRAPGGGHDADDKATPPRERRTEPTAGGSREATGATRCNGASEERVEPHRSEPSRRPARSHEIAH
jgi:hypothetical protein